MLDVLNEKNQESGIGELMLAHESNNTAKT